MKAGDTDPGETQGPAVPTSSFSTQVKLTGKAAYVIATAVATLAVALAKWLISA